MICECLKDYKINSGLNIDVNRDVNISKRGLIFIMVWFGIMKSCRNNRLKSLVGKDYDLLNWLENLENGPPKLRRNYILLL